MRTQKDFCPNCGEEREIENVEKSEVVQVRGESYSVRCRFGRCLACGEEFFERGVHGDPLAMAYALYRTKHGFAQPEEILAFREKHGLSQRELGALLGWGAVTLSRYENGALQDEAHDRALQLAMIPGNLLLLMEKSPGIVASQTASMIRERIRQGRNREPNIHWKPRLRKPSPKFVPVRRASQSQRRASRKDTSPAA